MLCWSPLTCLKRISEAAGFWVRPLWFSALIMWTILELMLAFPCTVRIPVCFVCKLVNYRRGGGGGEGGALGSLPENLKLWCHSCLNSYCNNREHNHRLNVLWPPFLKIFKTLVCTLTRPCTLCMHLHVHVHPPLPPHPLPGKNPACMNPWLVLGNWSHSLLV